MMMIVVRRQNAPQNPPPNRTLKFLKMFRDHTPVYSSVPVS